MAWWIFQNAVVTAALAVVVLLVCRFVRIGPVARHALWVLVLVKFVTPPVIEWPWPAPDPFRLAASDLPVQVMTPFVALEMQAAVEPAASSVADSAGASTSDTGPLASIPGLVWIWALGAVGLLGIESVRLLRLARRVRHGGAADPAIVSRVARLSAQLELKPIPVVAIAGVASPMVWGFGRTRLLWPEDLSAENPGACLDGLIVHELAHVKRRDHLVGWIELAAGVVWWWNPLFWFVRAALREQAELACDAWVISALPNGRRAYAESLLALAGAALRGTPSPAMAVMGIRAGSRRVLERRLVMIMKGRAPLRLPFAGLLTLALISAATLPTWATGQQSAPPPPPPAAVSATQASPPAPAIASKPSQAAPPAPAIKTAPARAPKVVDETVPVPQASQERQAVRKDQSAPPPPPKVVTAVPARNVTYFAAHSAKLPEDGQQLLKTYEADVDAIYKELDPKIEARRQTAIKALEALQEQYTKAGKLDEAVAIRDYLRAGGPRKDTRAVFYTWSNKAGK